MGTGCSIKPVFFFHYHNLHPKKVSSNKSRGKIKDFESYQKEEKKDTPTIEKKINSSSKETLDKLRILTSNLNYELLKKGKNIKEIITTEDTHLWANFDIIEELNIYVILF